MTTPPPVNPTQSSIPLYEQDYYNWLEKTAKLLRDGKLAELDRVNLAEEIEDLGRSEKRAVESNLEIVLRHLLKYKYQRKYFGMNPSPQKFPSKRRSNSWRFTILEHRDRLKKSFRDSPSLRPYFATIFIDCYESACKKAAVETGLSLDTFPAPSPFTPEETLNPDFYRKPNLLLEHLNEQI